MKSKIGTGVYMFLSIFLSIILMAILGVFFETWIKKGFEVAIIIGILQCISYLAAIRFNQDK